MGCEVSHTGIQDRDAATGIDVIFGAAYTLRRLPVAERLRPAPAIFGGFSRSTARQPVWNFWNKSAIFSSR